MENTTDPLIKDEEVVIRGTVVYLNLEPLGWCGNGNVTILTTHHSEMILHLVGGRRPQPYFADVRLGDFVEACGIVTEENAISVTNPEKHYLRLELVSP
jgi:hypothetical protein